jgi:hypothetical protein
MSDAWRHLGDEVDQVLGCACRDVAVDVPVPLRCRYAGGVGDQLRDVDDDVSVVQPRVDFRVEDARGVWRQVVDHGEVVEFALLGVDRDRVVDHDRRIGVRRPVRRHHPAEERGV